MRGGAYISAMACNGDNPATSTFSLVHVVGLVSYLDILRNIDSNGRLITLLYDKRGDFDFAIVKFPFLCGMFIPLSPAYGVYVSQLIRYARACFVYEDCSKHGKLLTNKLMLQGYNESRLK
jgi:hypothetical protein